MSRAEALDGDRLYVQVLVVKLLYILHRKDVFRRFELARQLPHPFGGGSLACGGKGYALVVIEFGLYIVYKQRVEKHLRKLL